MPPIENLIAFTLAALVLNISPGPSNMYVMARSISQGVRGGVAAALGMSTGSLLAVIATAAGISVVFQQSPLLYTLIKLAGACYLVYLGVGYWRAGPVEMGQARPSPPKPLGRIYKESILVEITNPKMALFFLAFLPQFVVPEAGPVWSQLLVLGLIVTVSALPCDLVVAYGSSRVAQWLIRHEKAQIIQERVSGSILLLLGSGMLAEEARRLAGP